MRKTIKRIFSGVEVTVEYGNMFAIVSKWDSLTPIFLSNKDTKFLISSGILEFVSGNFETYEKHYRICEIGSDNISKLKMCIKKSKNNPEYINFFKKMLKCEERKIKIEKLNNL